MGSTSCRHRLNGAGLHGQPGSCRLLAVGMYYQAAGSGRGRTAAEGSAAGRAGGTPVTGLQRRASSANRAVGIGHGFQARALR